MKPTKEEMKARYAEYNTLYFRGLLPSSTVISNVLLALDDFPMTAEEYLGNRQEVTRRAIEHYRQMLYCLHDNTPDGAISEILKAKFRALLAAEADWIALPVEADSRVSCRINDARITGRARIDPKRIRISLDDGPSKECILLDLAPCIFTDEPFVGSPANEYGQNREARKRLVDSFMRKTLLQKQNYHIKTLIQK